MSDPQRGTNRKPTILHLAVEYNDPFREPTTKAVEWHVAELGDYDNVVVSLVRTSNPLATYWTDCGHDRHIRLFACGFFGLPFGIGLLPSMWVLARRVRRALDQASLRPDLIHAHKLTFEGLAGWFLSHHYGVPLFVSLRGEVETKVFRMKPALRPLLRRIARDSARIYHVSAWFRGEYHRHVPERTSERLLPNIVRNAKPTIEIVPPDDRFVTVFNLDIWKKKGFDTLLKGFQEAVDSRSLGLDVIGRGTKKARTETATLVRRLGLENRVRFLGAMDNAELLGRLPVYRAMLLPSLNETFGMVYVEALFAGVPVLYTRDTGIDGYLDDLEVGISVQPRDARGVAKAILKLDDNFETYRSNLLAGAGVLYARLGKESIMTRYRDDITEVLEGPSVGALTAGRSDDQ